MIRLPDSSIKPGSPFYYDRVQTFKYLLACQGSQVSLTEFFNVIFDIFEDV
jgi:hypothetical protein